jgi:hypothetical protein
MSIGAVEKLTIMVNTCSEVGTGERNLPPTIRRWAAGLSYQYWWKVVVIRWDATHRSNTGGTCGGSGQPDESKINPS